MPPSIIGPPSWSTCASPPRFRVHTDGCELYSVELAETPTLMARTAGRCRYNYFFGGDTGGDFATGRVWQVPERAWLYLRQARHLYYRVVAVDQRSGTPVPSVPDRHLDTLPTINVRACALDPVWSEPLRRASAARPETG